MPIDERVRELLARGDVDGAASEAIRGLGPQVVRYLRSVLRDEGDVADAFSHFSEDVWRSLPRFRGDGTLRTWAYRLAWHSVLDVRDAAWRRRGRRFATHEASRIAEEIRTRTYQRVERERRALDELRASLPAEERSLLALRVDQELSWDEIAGVMAAEGHPVEVNALTKRFERLKEKLATLARERGFLEQK